MKKTARYLRKVIILTIGIPIILLGIILVPLPGPGFLVIFIGLFILSLEFEWAEKHRNTIQAKIKNVIDQSRERTNRAKKD